MSDWQHRKKGRDMGVCSFCSEITANASERHAVLLVTPEIAFPTPRNRFSNGGPSRPYSRDVLRFKNTLIGFKGSPMDGQHENV
jgi:hypothetical protein